MHLIDLNTPGVIYEVKDSEHSNVGTKTADLTTGAVPRKEEAETKLEEAIACPEEGAFAVPNG